MNALAPGDQWIALEARRLENIANLLGGFLHFREGNLARGIKIEDEPVGPPYIPSRSAPHVNLKRPDLGSADQAFNAGDVEKVLFVSMSGDLDAAKASRHAFAQMALIKTMARCALRTAHQRQRMVRREKQHAIGH